MLSTRRVWAMLTRTVHILAVMGCAVPCLGARLAFAQAPAVPGPPDVTDPMLEPAARPKVVLTRWEEALNLVRARSTDLQIAQAEVQRAEAQSRIALGAALTAISANGTLVHNFLTNQAVQPTLNANGTPGFRVYELPTADYANGSISLSQPLLNLRTWYGIGTANVSKEAARLSVSDAKRTILLGVANALVGAVTAERIAELNRVGLKGALERWQLTERMSNLGGPVTGLDVIRARQDVEQARSAVVTGDESLRQAREALGLSLGITKEVGVSPDVHIDELENSARGICKVAASIESRADIAAARKRVEVAERGIRDAQYQFLPTIGAQSSLATTSLDTGAAPKTTWNIQGVLSVPIWDGGIRYGQLRDTEAQRTQAEARLEAIRRTAVIQLEQARRGVMVAEQSRKVASDTRALAAETDRLTRTAFREGRGTSLELVSAAAALRQAEINLALREFELVRARVLALLALADCNY